ncbi:MAG: tetratricopeptide repeat protein [Planctomycetota bacterium]|nr:tetratricopeptide repeat protein [Planctomycetota bacterium]
MHHTNRAHPTQPARARTTQAKRALQPRRAAQPVLVALALTMTAALVGCGTQRPLHIVESSAKRHFDNRDYAAALADYQEYVDRKPGEVRVRYQLAQTYLELDQPAKAAEELTTVYNVDPLNDAYVDARAEALYRAGQRDRLVVFLQRQTAERGRVLDYLRLGKYQQLIGNADEARTALNIGAKIDRGQTIGPQMALADFYKAVGDRENELTRLRMAMYIEPMNQVVWERIRALGEVPGPSLALMPEEAAPIPGAP